MKTQEQILIVDDDPDVLEVAVDTVTDAGYRVLAARNGVEALAILEKNQVSAMISDIRMPGMTGVELFTKSKSRNIPTIFISGFADTLDLEQALQMGASDFIAKPFTNEEFLNSIQVALSGPSAASADEGKIHTQYCRVHIREFLSGPTVNQDVYIRLSEERFLRIARADSPLSRRRIDSYHQKGLTYFYIRKEHFAKYVDFNIGLTKAAHSGKTTISRDRKAQLLKQTSEMFLENVYVNGVNKEVFEEGREIVDTTIRLVSESDNLFIMLELLSKHSKSDYSQSLAVSIYSTLIAKQMGWQSAQTLFRVAMAGLLHDIGHRSIPETLIQTYHTNKFSLPDSHIQLYQSHPVIAYHMLQQIPGMPEEVPIAVLQHHENMACTGYPNRPPRLKLTPISRVLNVADAFCDALYSSTSEGEADLNPTKAIQALYPHREADFDPQMLRALFQVLEIPVPEKIAHYRTHGQ